MAVCKDHCIDLAALELCFTPVLRTLVFAPLKEATINQHTRLISNHLIRRSRHIAGCAMKMNPHRYSLAFISVPSLCPLCLTTEAQRTRRLHRESHYNGHRHSTTSGLSTPNACAYWRQAICMFLNFSFACAPIDCNFGTRSMTSIAR